MKHHIYGLCIIALIAAVSGGCQPQGMTRTDPQTEMQAQAGTQTEIQTETELQTERQSEKDSQAERQSETKSQTVIQSDRSETMSLPETVDQSSVLDMDQMSAYAIISQNQYTYPGDECVGEGHIILKSEEKDGIMTLYALTMYGEYQFHNENYFVKSAGTGVIPGVMEFTVNDKGAYQLYAVQWPEDGSRYVQSIQEMIPKELWDICISPTQEAREELVRQERAYAEEYLKKLGRKAEIGDYADFEYVLLTEAGVSVEASNRLLEYEKDLGSYPNWIGSLEKIEDGVRYVYRKDADKENGKVILTKAEYTTGTVVEQYEFDWQTGEPIEADQCEI